MIRVTTFADKTVAVFGLGASGNATAFALIEGGARVAAWDDSEASRAASGAAGVPLVDLRSADWSRFAALVLAPGVPLTHPEPHWTVKAAKAAGVEVIGDIELFFREREQLAGVKVVGVTGTNGKSTTTALTAHLLKEIGWSVSVGGNIGSAILSLDPLAADRVYVIELSSFQLDLTCSIHCDAAALLNVSPDHLDRHGTMENYTAVKAQIFANMRAGDTAIIGVDDDFGKSVAAQLYGANDLAVDAYRDIAFDPQTGPRLIRISASSNPAGGVFARDGVLIQDGLRGEQQRASLAGIGSLRGRHNWQNAAAAYALVWGLSGGTRIPQGPAFKTFPGLRHRLESIASLGPIEFINDSKATNADSTAKALAAFQRDILWIVGGRAKEGGISSLVPFFDRIRKAYLIGEASDSFAATLNGRVPFVRSGRLDAAVTAATRDAERMENTNPVVLLSPACASYDQFENFEERGDAFRRAVGAWPGVMMKHSPSPRGKEKRGTP